MKRLNEILNKKKAVVVIGKFNPPTKAHEEFLNKVMSESKIIGATPVIFMTHDMDRDNPLSFKERVKYLKMAMPKLESCCMYNSEYFSPKEVTKKLQEMGYTDAKVITKESDLSALISDFNSKLTEDFDSFSVVAVNENEEKEDSEKLMEYALNEDFDSFSSAIIGGLSEAFAKEMYGSVKEGLKSLDKIEESIQNIPNSLGVPRERMPQIKHSDMAEFMGFLKMNGVKVEELDIDVSNLLPTQKEIDVNKVKMKRDSLMASESQEMKPFMVSNDNHILDGHHQLYALKSMNAEMKVPAYKADCSIESMMNYAKLFPKAAYKSLEEDAGGTDASFYRKRRLSQRKSEIRKTRERQRKERAELRDKQFIEIQKAREIEYEKDKRTRQSTAI